MNFVFISEPHPQLPEPPPSPLGQSSRDQSSLGSAVISPQVLSPPASQPTESKRVTPRSPLPSVSRPVRTLKGTTSAEKTLYQNKRWSDRTPTAKPGVIGFAGRSPIACTVLNLSKFGALIEVSEALPGDAFLLVITANRVRSEVNCMVRWRNGARIGVHFAGPIHTTVEARRATQ
jgi:hypothetical protein